MAWPGCCCCCSRGRCLSDVWSQPRERDSSHLSDVCSQAREWDSSHLGTTSNLCPMTSVPRVSFHLVTMPSTLTWWSNAVCHSCDEAMLWSLVWYVCHSCVMKQCCGHSSAMATFTSRATTDTSQWNKLQVCIGQRQGSVAGVRVVQLQHHMA
jgi:hypothetical protein